MSMGYAGSGGGAPLPPPRPAPQPVEPELVPSGAWLDYDRLALAGADDARRGRLIPASRASEGRAAATAQREIERAGGATFVDPRESRGMFDHRYEAQGSADVPSDGRLHRVVVGARECRADVSWRAVPSKAAEVYREAELLNPFEAALLSGPADVYLDGSLLTTTVIPRVDRGGTLACGMGTDDRVKVARNVRVSEESAGLLGGSTAVTHIVTIELASSVRDAVKVIVLEALPITDDKALEVKTLSTRPEPAPYDQTKLGSPIRGGRRFDVVIEPGKKAEVEIVYRLAFSTKLDVVGGSRRG
jgi:uncharacterized protein (TIGR02231 family)